MGRLIGVPLALINRGEELVSTEIGRINFHDRLKRTFRFGNAAEGIERLAQLPRHFAIARVFASQFGKFVDGLGWFFLTSQ